MYARTLLHQRNVTQRQTQQCCGRHFVQNTQQWLVSLLLVLHHVLAPRGNAIENHFHKTVALLNVKFNIQNCVAIRSSGR